MTQSWATYIRFYFPRATDQECQDILWGNTSFPFGGRARVKRDIQKLPRAVRRAKKAGKPLCDFCHNPVGDLSPYNCNNCYLALRNARYEA